MIIKICGMTRPADACFAAECGAEYVGIVLAPSPRRATVEQAGAIVSALPATTRPVLVFRDQSAADILSVIATLAPFRPLVQLHGREPVALARELTIEHAWLRIIRAVEVQPAAPAGPMRDGAACASPVDMSQIEGFAWHAILLDSPKSGTHPGFDRMADVARQLSPAAVWLAGRLTPESVAAALHDGPFEGVDVASGVECAPGVKDPDRVRAFIAAARATG